MAIYVTLYNYSGPIKGGGPERFKQVQEAVAAEGGKILHVYGLLGSYDVMAIGEFPDNRAAMKAAAKTGGIINASSNTMPAIERDDFLQLLSDTVDEIWVFRGG